MSLQETPGGVDASAGMAIVPPRPNLGPEPLPERTSGLSSLLFVAPVSILVGLAGLRFLRRRSGRKQPAGTFEAVASDGDRSDLTPGVRLLALADRARGALVERFGEDWRAKTTEEIASDGEFSIAFDPTSASAILDLLHRADLEKFACRRPADQGDVVAALDSWEALLGSTLFEAGATSTIKGK